MVCTVCSLRGLRFGVTCIPYLPTEFSSKSLEAEQDLEDEEDMM